MAHLIVDIETENTGFDVMKDNKRIISVQLGDASEQEVYYADSKDPRWTLHTAGKRIRTLLHEGHIFAGYNVSRFDIPILKQFLGVEIPESNVFDLSQTPTVLELNRSKKFSLEDVCHECGIEVNHKRKMNERADKYRNKQDIRVRAEARARALVQEKGWGYGFSYDRALSKIAVGSAILDAYMEFVESGGQKNTLFYEYAIGDVICEHSLLKLLESEALQLGGRC